LGKVKRERSERTSRVVREGKNCVGEKEQWEREGEHGGGRGKQGGSAGVGVVEAWGVGEKEGQIVGGR